MRRLAVFLLALGLAAAANAQPRATHTVSIDYEQTRGDLRRATLTLAPAEGVEPIPRGAVAQIGVLSKTGQWIIIESLRSADGSLHAEALLPAPDAIGMLLFKPARGPWRGVEFGVPNYTEVEWTYVSQRGRPVESRPCQPRVCFANVVESFNQAETLASSFTLGIILMDESETI